MASTAQTIKFNVGGTHYEVSKSLLENFKGSMLKRSASNVWNEGGNEVFIEGNGHRFQYVLDFMRHEKVTLPSSESIDAFLTEMKYYGIACDLEHVVKCGDNFFPKLRKATVDKFATLIAHDVLKKYFEISINSDKDELVFLYPSKPESDDTIHEKKIYSYLNNLDAGYGDIRAKVNGLLMGFGLEVLFITFSHDQVKVIVSRIE